MILAAGRGSRLRPLTDTLPKPLVEVGGRPVIEYPLMMLRSAGVREVVINLHHLGHRIPERLGDGSAYGLRITYSTEREILDTGGGIKNAEALLRGEPFIVINGDTIMDAPVASLVERHQKESALATLLLRDDPNAERYGLIHVDTDARVRSFLGTPPIDPGASWRPYMFAGLHVFSPRIFDHMPVGRPFSITRETYPKLVADGEIVLGVASDRPWLTIDNLEALEAANRALSTGATRLSFLDLQ